MAKAKEFTYQGEGPATVYLGGQPHRVEPGDTIEATTDAEQDSLDQNTDFAPVKGGKSKAKDK